VINVRHQWSLVVADARYYTERRRWAGLARSMWYTIARLHHGELCQECGRRYGLIWWAPQPLWDALMPTGGGLLCPACFNKKAKKAGFRLNWTPMVVEHNGVPTTNWWFDPVRDWLMMGEPDPDYHPNGLARVPQPTWARIGNALFGEDAPAPVYPIENRTST
jgi:hypothetical protein